MNIYHESFDISSKYFSLYCRIVSSSDIGEKYAEYHHIVPVSLGGIDDNTNIVRLSTRKHFIAHYLLTKFCTGDAYHKMLHAFMLMKGHSKHTRYVNSRLYESRKTEYILYLKKYYSDPEVRAYLSELSKNWWTDERRKEKSEWNKEFWTEEQRQRVSEQWTEERKQNMSDSWTDDRKEKHNKRHVEYWQKNRKTIVQKIRKAMTPERREKISDHWKNSIWIIHPETGKRKRLPREEATHFLDNGWVRGKKLLFPYRTLP